MQFQKFARENISEKIIEHVKEMIVNGQLKPGDRLPAEETLASQMGVGRGTVREALRVLAYVGLLERRKNGTYIAEGAGKKNSDDSITSAIRQYSGYMEIIEVRRVVEPELAALAAARATPEQVTELGDHYQRMLREQGDRERFIDDDNQFHRIIFAAAGNSLFQKIMATIQEVMRDNQAQVIRRSQIMPRSLEFHERLYAAIKEGDSTSARRIMREHVEDIEREMQKIFRRSR
jgi:GntR family transcriptional repressor for pyruvate dehydrogenase complex